MIMIMIMIDRRLRGRLAGRFPNMDRAMGAMGAEGYSACLHFAPRLLKFCAARLHFAWRLRTEPEYHVTSPTLRINGYK